MPDKNSSDVEEIWAVFGEESRENLDQVENCLLRLEADPCNLSEIPALFRAMHTIKGSSRMMGLEALERLGHRSEDLISLVRDQKMCVDDPLISLLLSVADCLRRMLEQAVLQRLDLSDLSAPGLFLQLDDLISSVQILNGTASSQVSPQENAPLIIDKSSDTAGIVDLIDLASDATSVRIFFEMADESYRRIDASLNLVTGGEIEGIEAMVNSIDSLRYAAVQMGYHSLDSILLELGRAAQTEESDPGEICGPLLICLSNELEMLRDVYPFLCSDVEAVDQPVAGPDSGDYGMETPSGDSLSKKELPQVTDRSVQAPVANQDRDSSEKIKLTLDAIAEIIGEQAILHRLIARLEQVSLVDSYTDLARKTVGNDNVLRNAFEPILLHWQEQTALIASTEKKIGTSLSQLHETLRSIYLKHAADIFGPLQIFILEQGLQNGKSIELDLDGGAVELDQSLVASLDQCLRMLIETIVMDSIETPDERQQAGKSPYAQLKIGIVSQGGNLQVNVQDDGRGVIKGDVIQKVRAILDAKQSLFIDQCSKAGVSLCLSLPLRQSVIDGMVVRIGKMYYMIAIDSIQRILRQEHCELYHSSADGKQTMLRLGDEMLPIYYFSNGTLTAAIPLLVVIEGASRQYALRVDEIIGQQRASIIPFPKNMHAIQNASGCVMLGEGEIGVVLDINSVFLDKYLY